MNSVSISIASNIISLAIYSLTLFFMYFVYNRQAKLACKDSSLAINSLLKVKPGIKDLFFNQNKAQNEPAKNTPSTILNAKIL